MDKVKEVLKKYTEPQGLWRIFCMMTAIFLMGVSLSFLILVDMGTDPFSFMNRGFAAALHMSFGTWQLLMNVILFLITFLFQKNLIGLGTLVNMTAIGYVADFFGSVWDQIEIFHNPMPMMLRLVILAGALAVFVLTAAIYMTAQLGMAPYDAVPFIIAKRAKKLSFRWIRMLWDTAATMMGILLGMKLGAITVLMVLTLGPVVSWFGEHVAGKLFERG